METGYPNQSSKAICSRRSGLVNKVQIIYNYTTELLDLLENKTEMNRDGKIQLIHEFLEEREKEISGLSAPYTDQEIELGRLLVDLNEKLGILLEREKVLIQKDIKELHAKKESNQKYSNPYESFTTGGVFYDKRN
jgi:flagellar protein FliT